MIGCIKGTLIEKQSPDILVDVSGVGYELQVPMSTIFKLPEIGTDVILHTHFVVREDAQLLYGFATKTERLLFKILIKVNGVGPKMGIAIMSGIEVEQLVNAVQHKDITTLVKVPGIGKKTAERLLVELTDKLAQWDAGPLFAEPAADFMATPNDENHQQDAESALQSLGYSAIQASKAVKKIYQNGLSSDELIRLALKNMM
jgi:holliday junction DNA helicase RuvA